MGSQITLVSRDTAKEFKAVVSSIGELIGVTIVSELANGPPLLSIVKSLAVAVAKGNRNDFLCEKVCELGVHEVIFWQAARSVVRVRDERDKVARTERWRRIAESACKQSGGVCIPEIAYLNGVEDLIRRYAGQAQKQHCAYCCTDSFAHPLASLPKPESGINVVIGPEGDFTAEEESNLRQNEFIPVSLGPRVLRVDTAAIAVVSAANSLWGFIGKC